MSNANRSAFPVSTAGDGDYYLGLTKREYFAAAAMQGMLASPTRDGNVENFANDAVLAADALIAELGKKP